MKFKLFILFIITSLFCVSCTHADYLNDPYRDIAAFHKVNDNLYRGGRPDISGLRRLKDSGVKTILSLEEDEDSVRNEMHISEAFGFNFCNIPASSLPTDEEVLDFLDIVTDRDKFPVFVHCKDGRYVTGLMIAVHRVVIDGWTTKRAYEEAKNLGSWPYFGKAELKEFIYQLKDKNIYFMKVNEKI